MKPSISPTCIAMVGKSVGEKANKQTNDTSAILWVTFWETYSKGGTSNLQPFLPNRFPKRPISFNYINRKITLNEYVRELKRQGFLPRTGLTLQSHQKSIAILCQLKCWPLNVFSSEQLPPCCSQKLHFQLHPLSASNHCSVPQGQNI